MNQILELLEERTPQKLAGLAFAVLIAGYTVFVVIAGGLVNSEQPSDYSDWEALIVKHAIEKQNLVEVLQEAYAEEEPVNHHVSIFNFEVNYDAVFWGQVEAAVDAHKAFIRKEEELPENVRFDTGEFLQNQYPQIPSQGRLLLDTIELKTAEFQTGQYYTLLAATNENTQTVFEDLVERAIKQKLLISTIDYDKDRDWGYFDAQYPDFTAEAVVAKRDIFPGYDTVIYIHFYKGFRFF